MLKRMLGVTLIALAALVSCQTYDEESSVGDSCRQLTEMEWHRQAGVPPEMVDEQNYRCGEPATEQIASAANFPIPGQADFLDTLLRPAVSTSGQCPDRSRGTAADLKSTLRRLYPITVMNIATNNVVGGNITEFLKLTKGYTYGGGEINRVGLLENLLTPTVGQYIKSIPTLLTDGTTRLPKPIGADTKAFVADFQAPAPRTQAAFFFFGTELLNPCMWSTNSDFLQANYVTGNNEMVADCPECKAHRGFLRAFNSITNTSNPKQDIAAAWTEMTGVPATEVTAVLCGGFSMGAALATLCGPWAKATFPNAKVEVVTAGSPRIFNPEGAAWYNANVANTYRIVNNKDIVPSLPLKQFGLLKYEHVGMPIFLDRQGKSLPGSYVAFAQERPVWYTGSVSDHVAGYILGMKQAISCTSSA